MIDLTTKLRKESDAVSTKMRRLGSVVVPANLYAVYCKHKFIMGISIYVSWHKKINIKIDQMVSSYCTMHLRKLLCGKRFLRC